MEPDLPNALPPRFQVKGELGHGGMGSVYRAFDRTLGRDVAVKLLDPSILRRPGHRDRFLREARAAARLDHPNVVAIHDFDGDAGYLVMELVEGEPLDELSARGEVSTADVRRVAEDVLAALEAAHGAGIVHRDVKPSNLIRRRDGRVVLVDFGVARFLDAELTATTGSSLGTPAFMAPEQFRGERTDERADLYSLGASLYQLVVRERYDPLGSSLRQAKVRLQRACPDRSLCHVIARCLEPDRTRRFPTAAAAASALRLPPPIDWRRPGRIGAAVAALAAAVAIAWGVGARARTPASVDAAIAQAWRLAQRGEHERARDLVDEYLVTHPNDPQALTLHTLVLWWTGSPEVDAIFERVLAARLTPAQRTLVRTVNFIQWGRESEALAYAEASSRRWPDEPEVAYALGEAQWHAGRLRDGASTLQRAFERHPSWIVALHHVVELALSEGRLDDLRAIARRMRELDGAAAASLECKILASERRYDEAAALARDSAARFPDSHLPVERLAESLALSGDYDAAERAAREAFGRRPVDDRQQGAYSLLVEIHLYRGELDEYLRIAERGTMVSALAQMLWLGRLPDSFMRPVALERPYLAPLPFWVSIYFLYAELAGIDERQTAAGYRDLEVRAYAAGIGAERRGELVDAAAQYEAGLAVPSRGDLRMLLSHHLARVRRQQGDRPGAAQACDEVLHPREYQPHRALLLPDCLLWSGEAEANPTRAARHYRRLVDSWRGGFAHPAVTAARERLAATP